MKELRVWRHCDVNPALGRASFDGIELRTDRMTDPRWDRVLPIFEDEQVMLTRLMSDRVQPGLLVLDVGTGSGVLAVWAAMHRCQVVGIDVSRRALQFARENARRNRLPVVTSPAQLKPGSVCFLRRSAEVIGRSEKNHSAFDLVLLNPPFNPTCRVFRPALHAEAGPIAQAPFDRQIRIAARMLRTGGYCVGVQMSYDADESHVRAIDQIRKAFRGHCRITYTYAHAAPRTVGVLELLQHEYGEWLSGDRGTLGQQKAVQRYADRIGGHGEQFSLVHYQVCKTEHALSEPPRLLQPAATKRMRWDKRFWCHWCIAHYSRPG